MRIESLTKLILEIKLLLISCYRLTESKLVYLANWDFIKYFSLLFRINSSSNDSDSFW